MCSKYCTTQLCKNYQDDVIVAVVDADGDDRSMRSGKL
jgi:hypothetical protein